MNQSRGSPSDLKASGSRSGDLDGESSSSPFYIARTKDAPVHRLKRWRHAALVLNASRRFRYTLDLKKEEEKQHTLRKIKAHAQAIRAAYLFKEAADQQVNGIVVPKPSPTGDFPIGQEELVSVTRDHKFAALQQYGGVTGLGDLLKTNLDKGIHGDDIDLLKRKNAFGSNTYPRKKARSFWRFLWVACQDLTLIILMVAAMASLALGIKTEGTEEGWSDGGCIAFAVLLVIVVTAVSDYRQSLQFQNLTEEKRNIHLEVIRGGRRVKVSIYDLVVGDVVPLNIGDQVPADGILIIGHSLLIDESSMTGESKIVRKNSKNPFLMSGCKVAVGNGSMLVTSVGTNTEWGMLMASISEDTGEETPLQVRLNGVATSIGIVGLTVALPVLIVLLFSYFSGHTKNANGIPQFQVGKTKFGDGIDGAIKIVIIAVTIVVAGVPEGLPLSVTLTLAYSMRKLMADKALVRRLSACETMGFATAICCDKTGTLTLNQMTVVEAFTGGRKIDLSGSKSDVSPILSSLLIEGISLNTNGSVYTSETGGDIEVSGSPTEKAILQLGIKLGMNFDAIRSKSSILHVFPFNSEKKRGGAAVKLPNTEVHIHWKGAAEIVLACCTKYLDPNDQLAAMDEDKSTMFRKSIEDMAARSLRCVAIAYRPHELENVPADEQLSEWALPDDDLVLLAIVGIKDPCRPGVGDAVRLCQKAGVKVIMVTGDNLQTAKAIAMECGILAPDSDATQPTLIEGTAFRELSDKQREDCAEKISVMGRSSHNDKLLLVQALRRRGHVVAVTGDGTNDAPALREADIGLAMGIQGTEVAKENSDIIILDDNFASVVKVVRWGRSIYEGIQKFTQFHLTTLNVAAVTINAVAAISSGDVPLNAVQVLWVNLIMDTVGVLALATEPPTDHLMDRPPVGQREPLITNIMWRNLLVQAFYQVTVLLVLNFRGISILKLHGPNANTVKNTLIFNTFVLCQIFNEFIAQKPDEFNIFKGITKNYLFIGIVTVTLVLQIIIVEFLGKFTKTKPLNWNLWLISAVIAFISWPLAVLGKLIPVPETPLFKNFTRMIPGRRNSPEAAYLFKEAADQQVNGIVVPKPSPTGDFPIGQEELVSVTRDHKFAALQQYGGVTGLGDLLKTNLDKGIHGDDIDLLKRKNAFGSNTYPRKKARSFWRFLWVACQDLTLIILMVAAMASLALGIKTEGIEEGWYDGGSIAFALLLVIVVTAVSDYRQSLKFQNLNEEKRNIHLEVIRGGRRVEVSIYDLVVGDVAPLNIGDQVPADGILITGHSLAIDESSMTGESKIVRKDSKNPFLMSGCKVADGNGSMLVTSVGTNTEWGMLMASISEDTGEETPLQVRLNGVATFIGIVGLTVALLVLIVLLVRYFTGHTKNANGSPQFKAGKTKFGDAIDGAIKIVTIAVTIVVVAVPEGLPLAVTLTLAYSMRKMMADKALVRRLSACETMGSATTICSDKTGTLTLNQMTVVEAFTGGRKIDLSGSKSDVSPILSSLLIEGIALNTNGSVYTPETGGDIEVSGSPTEKAILQLGIKLGMNFDAIRSKSSILHVFPFNSEKKRGGAAVKLPNTEVHIHWKGAAEIVLACCTKYLDPNDQLVAMDEDKSTMFRKSIEDMAARSLRCVAIAYRPHELENVPADEQLSEWALPDDDLVLLAIVGIKDPCRPGVGDAVRLCQKAGVKVRMVTGDNLQTAKAIAMECGILAPDSDANQPTLIEGTAFRELSDKQREDCAEKISVMGRSSPNDKLLLVQALRRRGHVVAVTGDGTNDAPALHEADIGLAMGIQGTEVAKESSDIIILDDNFASVVKVVRWGRSVYANIQKFIQFQLTVNVAALIINVVAAISSGDVPLNAVQLLWVNLIMDTLGALALATEPPTDHLMDRPPVGRREPLITNIMWRNLLVQAFYQVTVLLVFNFRGISILKLHGPNANTVKNTLIFNTFVLCQIFNEFNARKPDEFNIFKGITKNYLFIGIVTVTLVLQIIIVEFLGKFTKTKPLTWNLWLISAVIAFISWPLAVLGKLIPVPETPLFKYFTRMIPGRRNSPEGSR